MVANNGFTGTCYTCGEVGHRSSDHIDRGRHQSRHPMRRYGGHGGEHYADSRQGDHHVDNRQGHGGARPGGMRQGGARQGGAGHEGDFHGRGRQGVTSIVSDCQMMATTIGATPGQHLSSDITTVINLTIQILHRTTTSSTAPLQPLWPRTMLVTNSTRRQLWSIPVPCGTCSTIYPSSTNSSLSHPRL
jgi:Zinc knuckle